MSACIRACYSSSREPLYDTGSNPALLIGNKNGPSLQPLPSITLSESYCLDVLRLKYDVEGRCQCHHAFYIVVGL